MAWMAQEEVMGARESKLIQWGAAGPTIKTRDTAYFNSADAPYVPSSIDGGSKTVLSTIGEANSPLK